MSESTDTKIPKTWRLEAERRRAKRRKLELSLAVVAGRIGVPFTRVHRWEKCRYRPTDELAKAWDAALYKEAP